MEIFSFCTHISFLASFFSKVVDVHPLKNVVIVEVVEAPGHLGPLTRLQCWPLPFLCPFSYWMLKPDQMQLGFFNLGLLSVITAMRPNPF